MGKQSAIEEFVDDYQSWYYNEKFSKFLEVSHNSFLMLALAYMLQLGHGIEKNVIEAVRYFRMSIEQGNIHAINQLRT